MSSRLLRSPSDQAVSSPGQEYFVLFLGKTILTATPAKLMLGRPCIRLARGKFELTELRSACFLSIRARGVLDKTLLLQTGRKIRIHDEKTNGTSAH